MLGPPVRAHRPATRVRQLRRRQQSCSVRVAELLQLALVLSSGLGAQDARFRPIDRNGGTADSDIPSLTGTSCGVNKIDVRSDSCMSAAAGTSHARIGDHQRQ